MARSDLPQQAETIARGLTHSGWTGLEATNAVGRLVATVVAICNLRQDDDLLETYQVLRDLAEDEDL